MKPPSRRLAVPCFEEFSKGGLKRLREFWLLEGGLKPATCDTFSFLCHHACFVFPWHVCLHNLPLCSFPNSSMLSHAFFQRPLQHLTEHALLPAFALASNFSSRGGARDVGPLVCPPACACLFLYLDFNFRLRLRMARLCPALLSSRPPGSQCLCAPPACLSHLDVGPPASSARMPCPVTGTFLSPPARALPAARHGRPARLVYLLHACTACDFFVAPPAACLPPVTSCTFLEQAIPQLWAASSKLARVAFRISA